MPADISAITYFAPIVTFLLVFVVIFAILFKTKILGENNWMNLFISLFIATIFVATAGAREYVTTIIPWFAAVLISIVLLFILMGFIGKPMVSMHKGIGVTAVIILGLVFLISTFVIFSDVIFPYLPGPGFGSGDSLETTVALDWLYSPRIAGAILLIVISAIVATVLVKAK